MSDERLLRILDRVDPKSPDAVSRVARALQKVHAALASKLAADADGTGIHFTREEGLALEAVAYREISHLFPAPRMTPAERREADAAEKRRQEDDAGRVQVVPRFWAGEF